MRYRTVFGLLLVAAILAGDMHGQQTTRGREFYVAFLPNYHNGGDVAPDSLYLFIVADEPTNGTITYTNNLGQTLTRTFSITDPQQIFVHRVQYRPYELFGYNNNGQFVTSNENEQISLRVFRVTADRDIALYALNQALTTSDATLVLPVTALGSEYYVMSYPSDGVVNTNGTLNGQYTPSEFVVVGVEDGTDVTIYPSAPTTESGMQVKTIRLNRGQAVLYQAEFSRTNLNYDLTGTRIVATKNIAVFAGHQRALVPVEMRGSLASRDQLYEQMIPALGLGNNLHRHAVCRAAGCADTAARGKRPLPRACGRKRHGSQGQRPRRCCASARAILPSTLTASSADRKLAAGDGRAVQTFIFGWRGFTVGRPVHDDHSSATAVSVALPLPILPSRPS